MAVPTCNFYHFLVSFASQASPEDTHEERAKDTGADRWRERGWEEWKGKAEKKKEEVGGWKRCHGGTRTPKKKKKKRKSRLRRDEGVRWGLKTREDTKRRKKPPASTGAVGLRHHPPPHNLECKPVPTLFQPSLPSFTPTTPPSTLRPVPRRLPLRQTAVMADNVCNYQANSRADADGDSDHSSSKGPLFPLIHSEWRWASK